MEKEAHLHYRGVSAVMKLWCADNKMSRAPSHETCIQWDLKIGLYKLQRAKAKDTPWCWMVDHVIGEGYMKCLAIIGIPLNDLQNKTDLTLSLQQMEPFGLVPMSSSTGAKVQEALTKISLETGIIPQAIVSDHGSDLLLGVKDYCRNNNGQTVELYDVCHKVAIELKKLLINDSSWAAFSTKAAETKRLLYSTEGVDFAPPNQRRKGRYMNVDILIGWANRILEQKEQIPQNVLEKLSWVWDEQEKITLWGQWVEIAKQSRNLIRQNGFHNGASDLLKDRLMDLPLQESSVFFLNKMLTYISLESNKLGNNCKMIGTTEPLESLFGYFKRVKNGLWDEQGGVGRLILSMASRVGEITEELVKNSLEYITVSGVSDWLKTCRV
jgi:hypothetical protein